MKTVVIGGGHGASASLRAALLYADEVGGVITVADDGGSSGKLARELGVLPMGDIRNCLAAIAPPSPTVDVFQHRFPLGPLEGHVVGNLIMAAVYARTGNFMTAIEFASDLLGSRGRIVPPTLEDIKLVSEVEGKIVEGQVAVAQARGRISYVRLEPPEPRACEAAIEELESADQIVLGPGSLFTSVLPPLLVPDVREAYSASKAQKVLVCNLASPPGETEGFNAEAHLHSLYAHLGPDSLDWVVAHVGRKPLTDAPPVAVDVESLADAGVHVWSGDFLPEDRSPRHDPVPLASALRRVGEYSQ